VEEFCNPPPPETVGSQGQVVLSWDGKLTRLRVDQAIGKPARELDRSGWKVRVLSYLPNLDKEARDTDPSNPLVELELTAPDGNSARFGAVGRMPSRLFPYDQKPLVGDLRDVDRIKVWYHPPDQRFAQDFRAFLQLAVGDDQQLYFRSFNSHQGKFAFEKGGPVAKGEVQSIWGGMDWKLKIAEFLPQAVAEPWFHPENLRPGFEDKNGLIKPALRCRLRLGNESKDFWVSRSENATTHVTVAGEDFDVGYNDEISDLGFEITLLRAEEYVDPGTTTAASYTSYVQLTDKKENIQAEDRIITMNQPLEHRGYKFFQIGLNPVSKYLSRSHQDLKPITVSIFTVSRDPGLILKYLGSTMLALGIACMFYMRAYFFKPRGRQGPAVI
jgi:hypothetical protein